MKRLLIKILILILPVLVLIVYCEYELKKIPNGFQRKSVLIEKQLDRIELLNLGASRECHGINYQIIGYPGFNLAYYSQDLYYNRQLLMRYIDRMPKLKLVILPIEYYFHQSKLEITPEEWRRFFYKYYFELPRANSSSVVLRDELRDRSQFALIAPRRVLKYALTGFSNVTDFLDSSDEYGWCGLVGHYPNFINDINGKMRVDYHNSLMRPEFVKENTEHVEQMVLELKKRNIAVVIITSPVYQTYAKFMKPEGYQSMLDMANSITQKHQLEYFNYTYDQRFTKIDFNDNDHLNTVGAAKLTGVIKADFVDRYMAGKK